jgi:type IV secretion system protein VirB10
VADRNSGSPDGLALRGAPAASARLSRKAALGAIAVLAAILGIVITNVSREQVKAAAGAAESKKLQPALGAARELTANIPELIPKRADPPPPVLPEAPVTRSGRVDPPQSRSSEDEARLADTAVPKFSGGESAFAADSAGARGSRDEPGAVDRSELRRVDEIGGGARHRAEGFAADDTRDERSEPDLNRQADKLAFQRRSEPSAYLASRVQAPLSPFELKTGTVIPAVLVGEVNSDLPGEIIAQVSQTVYDTATGNHVLIPQGTKILGRYDSSVAFGQSRLLVSWNRLIFPDASTLELGGMAGHDQAGKAGLADRVNNHYGRVFAWGLLTSVLSAGYELSQNQSDNVFVRPSDQQVAAAAVSQQMAQLGIEMARRNLQVQPTIEIRKGSRLNVMVNQDIVFPPSGPG